MAVDQRVLYQLVGDRVRRARKTIGWSQNKLAERLGMSRTSIVNIEAGRQHPPLHVLWKIAELLGTDPFVLIPPYEEYQEDGKPIDLDEETVAKIVEEAKGDLATRRALEAFIAKAKAATQEKE